MVGIEVGDADCTNSFVGVEPSGPCRKRSSSQNPPAVASAEGRDQGIQLQLSQASSKARIAASYHMLSHNFVVTNTSERARHRSQFLRPLPSHCHSWPPCQSAGTVVQCEADDLRCLKRWKGVSAPPNTASRHRCSAWSGDSPRQRIAAEPLLADDCAARTPGKTTRLLPLPRGQKLRLLGILKLLSNLALADLSGGVASVGRQRLASHETRTGAAQPQHS